MSRLLRATTKPVLNTYLLRVLLEEASHRHLPPFERLDDFRFLCSRLGLLEEVRGAARAAAWWKAPVFDWKAPVVDCPCVIGKRPCLLGKRPWVIAHV